MYKFLVMLGCALFISQSAMSAQPAKNAKSATETKVSQNVKNTKDSKDTKDVKAKYIKNDQAKKEPAKSKDAEAKDEEDTEDQGINWKKITPEEVTKMLKDGELKIDEYDYSGRTPLMNAAAECASPKVLETLIDSGSDVKFYPPTDNPEAALATSALFMASACPLETVKMLVEKGAGVNVYGEMGTSLLMQYAANTPDSKVIAFLIDKGANVKDLDENGYHVLMYALLNMENAHKIIDVLLEKGADINMLGIAADNQLFSVLDYAETNGLDDDAIKYLREKGAKHAAELY